MKMKRDPETMATVLNHLTVYGATTVKRLESRWAPRLSAKTVDQAVKALVADGLVRVEVRREFDRQGGEAARRGLFGGAGAVVRFRRYAVRINPEGDALAPEVR